MLQALFYILIFPGFLFVSLFAFVAEYVDRKLCARLQNRIGPPWYQPVADFIKLASKEEIVPQLADRATFEYAPVFALASCVTAFLYIPTWSKSAVFAFDGDLIVVIYLLTIPTITFFLAGWYSRSVYSMIGAARSIVQLFAYEVPFFLSILAPSLLAGTWSLSAVTTYYAHHLGYLGFNAIGFVVAIVALLGKLERVPFDIPEAETEIVAGTFTEYSGRLLALFRLARSVEMVVCASLVASVFFPIALDFGPVAGFVAYVLEVLFIVALISLLRSLAARFRIDQMINLSWKVAAPAAFAQVLISLAVKEALHL